MIFEHFLVEPGGIEANMYLVGCTATREAALIDCGMWSGRVERALREHDLTLRSILLTHDHWDHTGGLEAALKATGAVAYAGSDTAAGRRCVRLHEGDPFRIGKIEGRIAPTPGHTPFGITLILPGLVFTGDALFTGSVGGTGSTDDFIRQIEALRQHVLPLPDHYEVHGGHGPATTIAVERRFNPFFV